MAHLLLEDMLLKRIAGMPKSARTRFTGRTRASAYPFKVERLLNTAVQNAFKAVAPQIPEEIKNDDAYSVFLNIVTALTNLLAGGNVLNWPMVGSSVQAALSTLRGLKEVELSKYLKTLSGSKVMIPYNDTWWVDIERSLTAELGLRLTGSLNQYKDKLAAYVTKAISEKVPEAELIVGIKQLNLDISGPRAAFLARDLTGTINALSSQKMHTQVLGINTYLWVTAADERVRGAPGGPYASSVPSHYVMERLLGRWDNPAVYSVDGGLHWDPKTPMMQIGHPGTAYQCRCIAEAYLPGMVTQTKARLARIK